MVKFEKHVAYYRVKSIVCTYVAELGKYLNIRMSTCADDHICSECGHEVLLAQH